MCKIEVRKEGGCYTGAEEKINAKKRRRVQGVGAQRRCGGEAQRCRDAEERTERQREREKTAATTTTKTNNKQ